MQEQLSSPSSINQTQLTCEPPLQALFNQTPDFTTYTTHITMAARNFDAAAGSDPNGFHPTAPGQERDDLGTNGHKPGVLGKPSPAVLSASTTF